IPQKSKMAAVVGQNFLRIGRHQAPPVLATAYVQKRDASSTSLTAVKRGRGGRSSFSGVVATVFGASGFIGNSVVNRLGKIGSQVIIPYRGDPYWCQKLKLCGDLGQILFQPYQVTDEASIRKALKYSNTVINLVGRDWETKNFKFDDVNNKAARLIAKVAREEGIERLIHFSALNASDSPQKIYTKEGSEFLRTKAEGENAVREEFPDATIIRPSDVFGREDHFFYYYANAARRSRVLNTMPMWEKGERTIKQPVFLGDVAEGVINALLDPDAPGKVYEAVGPHQYYLCDLVDYFYRIMRWRNFKRTYMFPTFWAKVAAMSQLPNRPPLSPDKIEREFITDRPTGCPTLEDLGVKTLTSIEKRAFYDLKAFKANAYYDENLGEFAEASPPPKYVPA
ncbi:unnamed protein product, partial [Owenia fusiformis]